MVIIADRLTAIAPENLEASSQFEWGQLKGPLAAATTMPAQTFLGIANV
jgi:hypothetical protein